MNGLAKARLIESLRINKPIIVTAAITTAACLLIFALTSYDERVKQLLHLSPDSPWGVFTAIFVHSDIPHISANLVMLWLWTFYIILPDNLLSKDEMKRRVSFFPLVMVAVAVVTNITWVIALSSLRPDIQFSAQGASGLVYAFCGGAFGFAMMNMLDAVSRLKEASLKRRRVMSVILGNALVVIMIMSLVLYSPEFFLSKSPGTNVFAHGLGFLLGMGAVMGREYIPSFRRTPAAPIR